MTNRDDYSRDYGRNIGREDDDEGDYDYGRGARRDYTPNDRARHGREADYGRGVDRDDDYGPGPGRGGYGQGREGDYGRGPGRERGPSGERFGQGYRQPGSAQAGYGSRGSAAEAWQVPGPHTGRGPQDYRRSDERIEEDVNERLTQHGQIDASDVSVSVRNGEVTLQGTVDSRQAKRMAEDVAESVSGVQDVHNHLRLRQREQGGQATAGGEPAPEQARQRTPDQGQQGGLQQPDRAQATAGGRAVPEQVRQGMPEQGGMQQPDRAQAMTAGRTAQPEQARPGGPGQAASNVPPVRERMEVVGMDEVGLGHVQEVRNGEFVLDRGTQPALAVPFTFIHEITGERIRLKVRANQLEDMRSSGSGGGL
jgi:hypothetical protein